MLKVAVIGVGNISASHIDAWNAIENADKRSSKEPQDELTEDAIAFIFKSKQASVSMLQRRLRK